MQILQNDLLLVFNIVYRKIYFYHGFRWCLVITVGNLFFGFVLILLIQFHAFAFLNLLKEVQILLFDGVSKLSNHFNRRYVFRKREELGKVHIWSTVILGLKELLNDFEIAKGGSYIGRLLQLSIRINSIRYVLVDLIRLTLFQFTLVVDLLEIHQSLLLIVLVVLWCL